MAKNNTGKPKSIPSKRKTNPIQIRVQHKLSSPVFVGNQKKNMSTKKIPVMHVAKITDKYMLGSGNKNHTYVVYKENGKICAVPTTHLYTPDEVKMVKLHKGLLCKIQFAGYETPSGVQNYYYTSTKNGKLIDITNDAVSCSKNSIPKAQAEQIRKFVKTEAKL